MSARLQRYLQTTRERIDRALDRLLPPAGREPRVLHAAMRYGVLGGGKRLRPALTLLAYRAAGGRGQGAKPAACAIELVHAFSLIHDDLPCMDDDALRRGRPTVHRQFDEATALLAGDALLALAFEVLARTRPLAVRAALVPLLASSSGAAGMIGGQALEAALPASCGEAALREVHRLKTGRLFEASAAMGALAAETEPAVVQAVKRYARALGLAYQVADDLLDRGECDRASYADSLGEDGARHALTAAVAAARRACRAVPLEAEARQLLVDLADYVEARGGGAARKALASPGNAC